VTAIFGGADLFATAAATAAAFAADIGTIVDELQAAGAQHIVVWNTPNLGITPAVSVGGPQAQFVGSFVADAMNDALALRLAGEAGVATFDIFGFGSAAAADPGAFGFTNATDACGAVVAADCSKYFFWDGIHPTTAAHQLVADQFALVTASIPEPETYALLAIGLVAVVLQARRAKKVPATA
jgi:outer membrane lipase/esterase